MSCQFQINRKNNKIKFSSIKQEQKYITIDNFKNDMGKIHCGVASIRRQPETINHNKKYYVSFQSCDVSKELCYNGRFRSDGSLTPVVINKSSKLVVYSSIYPTELCRIHIQKNGTVSYINKNPIQFQIPLNGQPTLDFHFYYIDNDNVLTNLSMINCNSFNAKFIITEVL